MMEAIAFYIFAILITGLFLVTAFSRNILYAMSSLAAGMVLISGLFFILGADFLGAVQLVVYSGMVFLLSGISAVILIVIFAAPTIGKNIQPIVAVSKKIDNPHAIGEVLFTKYLIPFEVAAVMLLVAMIAGIVLASKKMNESLSEVYIGADPETVRKEQK